MKIDIKKILGLPTKSNELTYWGITDLKNGRYESALRYFNEALKLDPANKFIKEKIEDTYRKIYSENNNKSSEVDLTSILYMQNEQQNKDSNTITYYNISNSSKLTNDEFIVNKTSIP